MLRFQSTVVFILHYAYQAQGVVLITLVLLHSQQKQDQGREFLDV